MTAPQNEAPSTFVVGLVGAGFMGSGLGWSLRTGGMRVITALDGRSGRTARLAAAAGIEPVDNTDILLRTATHVLVVTPPGAAIAAAETLADAAKRTGARPVVADMNAISPTTAEMVATTLAPLDFVDGSISGPPPNVRAGARLYFAGSRAGEFAALPWQHAIPIDLGGRAGAASALKMSTASVYKGLVALYAQAIQAADAYGVLDAVVADLDDAGYDLRHAVAMGATKAHRYVPEMLEIAAAQAGVGLNPDLFAAFADIYAEMATTPLASDDPESVPDVMTAAEVVARLRKS